MKTNPNAIPNRFDADTAAELCSYLTPRQHKLVSLEVSHPYIKPLLESLPADRPELRAIAVMLADALYAPRKISTKSLIRYHGQESIAAVAGLIQDAIYSPGKPSAIPLIRFDIKIEGEFHQGVFTIDDYDVLFDDCFCLTEDWKESGQCQSLPQELTELVLWMLD